MGHAARFRYGADIDELSDVVSLQHSHKFVQRMRGMTDGEDREARLFLSRRFLVSLRRYVYGGCSSPLSWPSSVGSRPLAR